MSNRKLPPLSEWDDDDLDCARGIVIAMALELFAAIAILAAWLIAR